MYVTDYSFVYCNSGLESWGSVHKNCVWIDNDVTRLVVEAFTRKGMFNNGQPKLVFVLMFE